MTLRTVLPSIHFWTFGSARASASSVSLAVPGRHRQLVAHLAVDLHDDGDLILLGLFGIADGQALQVDARLVAQPMPQLLADVREDGRHHQHQAAHGLVPDRRADDRASPWP